MSRLIFIFMAIAAVWFPAAAACERQAQVNERPLNYAWWLKIRFSPCDGEIYGLPVRSIHPAWQRASLLREEYIPKSALYETGRNALEESKFQFELTGDFNGDHRPDRAAVGVYETASEVGRFLLIVTEDKPGIWRRAFLKMYPGKRGFLALRKVGAKLELWSCLECGVVSDLMWSSKQKQYVWLKAPKYD